MMPIYRKQEAPRGKPQGRYDAPPDPALVFPSLKLNEPFQFDGGFARRLFRREVNPKEAFTVRDAGGVFYRASLKEIGADGGNAVPYERMSAAPECAVE